MKTWGRFLESMVSRKRPSNLARKIKKRCKKRSRCNDMLKKEEAQMLFRRQENLTCTDPESARSMFFFVLSGEPEEKKPHYMSHIANCSYCQLQIELFRHKRDVAAVWAEAERHGIKPEPVPAEEWRPVELTAEQQGSVDELEREYKAVVAEEEAEEARKTSAKKK